MKRRTFVVLGAGATALAGLGSRTMAAIVSGKEYLPLSQPLPVDSADKIEVTEFFWYGCPHCFDLEPLLNKWVKNLPKDAEFKRIPAIFRESWIPGAKIFYTLETLGQLPRLHGDVFNAIHVDHVNFGDESVLFNWMATKGIDRAKFAEAYGSFNVQTNVRRAEQLTRQSRISGVPAVIVDGKYMTSASLTGSQESLLAALDELIVKARGEHKKK